MFFTIDVQSYVSRLRDLLEGVEEALGGQEDFYALDFIRLLNASMILGQAKELIKVLEELQDASITREMLKEWCRKGLFLEMKIKNVAKKMGIVEVIDS